MRLLIYICDLFVLSSVECVIFYSTLQRKTICGCSLPSFRRLTSVVLSIH